MSTLWREMATVIGQIDLQAALDGVGAFLLASWHVFHMAAPFLLLGFILAGLAHVLLPTARARQWLGKPGWRGIVRAAMLGVPLPLCSCSVIPVALALRKQGASKGAMASFLISTPATGVDSIALTYGLLDGVITLFRPIAALFSGVVGGFIVQAVTREHFHTDEHGDYACSCEEEGNRQQATGNREEEAGNGGSGAGGDCCAETTADKDCCGHSTLAPVESCYADSGGQVDDCCSAANASATANATTTATTATTATCACCANGTEADDCCSKVAAPAVAPPAHLSPWYARALRFSFVTVARDMVWAMLIGFLVAGAMETLLPADFFTRYMGNEFLAIAVMLLVGMPLYVCASASTPIAAMMIMMGLSPGAAMVFLMAGPATNVTTMIVVKQQLGWRALGAYIFSVAMTAVLAGLALNAIYHGFFGGHWHMKMTGMADEMLPAWLSYGSAAIVGATLAWAAARRFLPKRK